MCNNTIGSFHCSCRTGYLLDGNGFNCSGEQYLDHKMTSLPTAMTMMSSGALGNNINVVLDDMSYHGVPLSMQTSMSVRMVMTIVMRMQTALTQRAVSPALVTLATLEMESTV